MRYTYDDEADAVYIHLEEPAEDIPVARSEVVDEGRVVDFSPDGRPVGIEVLAASAGVRLTDLAEKYGLGDVRDHFERLEEVKFQALADA